MPPCPLSKCCSSCQICETITDSCSGAPVVGALVTIKQGTTTIGTGVTSSTGQCCVRVPAAGSYQETVSATNYSTATFASFSAICPGNNPRAHALSSRTICVNVTGCSGNYAGATVTFTSGGTTYTATTDSGGKACTPPGIATGTWTVNINPNDVRYQTPAAQTANVTSLTNCVSLGPVFLSPSSSCCCFQCSSTDIGVLKCLTSLSFTSNQFGSFTATGEGCGPYTVSFFYPYRASGSCPARSVPVMLTINVINGSLGAGMSIEIGYGLDVNGCPGGTDSNVTDVYFTGGAATACTADPLSWFKSNTNGGQWQNINGTPSVLLGGFIPDDVTITE